MGEEASERLETIIALLQLAFRDEIQRARTAIRADAVNSALLDGAKKWSAAAKLQAAVAKKTRSSTRTVQFRIADLLSQGLLEKRGGGRTIEYKATGLI